MRQQAEYQGPETEAVNCISAILSFISYTSAIPTKTWWQIVFDEIGYYAEINILTVFITEHSLSSLFLHEFEFHTWRQETSVSIKESLLSSFLLWFF